MPIENKTYTTTNYESISITESYVTAYSTIESLTTPIIISVFFIIYPLLWFSSLFLDIFFHPFIYLTIEKNKKPLNNEKHRITQITSHSICYGVYGLYGLSWIVNLFILFIPFIFFIFDAYHENINPLITLLSILIGIVIYPFIMAWIGLHVIILPILSPIIFIGSLWTGDFKSAMIVIFFWGYILITFGLYNLLDRFLVSHGNTNPFKKPYSFID